MGLCLNPKAMFVLKPLVPSPVHPMGKHIHVCMNRVALCQYRDGRFGSKMGQIGTKWDKSGAFSDQISVHLAPPFSDQISVHLARGRQMH